MAVRGGDTMCPSSLLPNCVELEMVRSSNVLKGIQFKLRVSVEFIRDLLKSFKKHYGLGSD